MSDTVIRTYNWSGNVVSQEVYLTYNQDVQNTFTSLDISVRAGCWWRAEQGSTECQVKDPISCRVNVYEPDFMNRWKGSESDSAYYTFTNAGFDPCHSVDLDSTVTFKYSLNCFDESYQNLTDSWFISYDSTTTAANQNFTDIIADSTESLKLSETTRFEIKFTIHDWNWITKSVDFVQQITTLDQLYGQENFTADIDFSLIPEDKRRDYTPGGRVHVGVYSSGNTFSLSSYGYFLEVIDYKEPTPKIDATFLILAILFSFLFAGLVGLVIFCYARKWYKNRQMH